MSEMLAVIVRTKSRTIEGIGDPQQVALLRADGQLVGESATKRVERAFGLGTPSCVTPSARRRAPARLPGR
jgi:hypothetical protein